MLRLAGTLARVVFGFALASIAAGLVTVLFVNTPADVLAEPASQLPQTASETFDLALLTATHAALFAAAFVVIVAWLGEWFSIRSLPFYLVGGMAIALLGFIAQFSSEVAGQPTILNNYAVKAFLTTGFFAGFVYWLAAGQFAGRPPEAYQGPSFPEETTQAADEKRDSVPQVPAQAGVGDSSVIITRPPEESKARYRSLINRLKVSRRKPLEPEADDIESDRRDDEGAVIIKRPATAEGPKAADGEQPGEEDL